MTKSGLFSQRNDSLSVSITRLVLLLSHMVEGSSLSTHVFSLSSFPRDLYKLFNWFSLDTSLLRLLLHPFPFLCSWCDQLLIRQTVSCRNTKTVTIENKKLSIQILTRTKNDDPQTTISISLHKGSNKVKN